MTHSDDIFLTVNDRYISLTQMLAMKKQDIKTLYASGCTGLTAIDAPAAKTLYARGCTGLTAIDAPAAKYLAARGCTGLTAIDAPAAEYLDASGCTGLTAIDAPAAEYLDARGCTGLTAIDAPAAKTLDASGCTGLTAIDAPKAKIEKGRYAFGGCDSRGYIFDGVEIRDQWRVIAGCRNFSIADARLHWGPGGHSNRPDCLALVEKIAADIAQQDAVSGKLAEV